jgi:PPP family 3-phenylpropionic acid transporter
MTAETLPARSPVFLKIFNVIFFAAYGSIIPFLVLFYEENGLVGREIGLLSAFPPLMILLGSAIWGAIADITSRHRQILLFSILGASVSGLLIGFNQDFRALIPMVMVFAFFISPIVPLLDNSVLETLKDRSDQYGKYRLWGAVGWGLATPTVGLITDHFGLGWSFNIYIFMMIIGFLVAYNMPVAQIGIGSDFRQGLSMLLRARRTQVFFLTMLFVGIGLAVIDVYLFLHLQNLGATNSLMGFTLTVGTISEIFVFIYADRLIKRWGTGKLLVISIFALALQLIGYSLIDKPAFGLLIQILHGPSFAGMWSAGVAIAKQVAPEGMASFLAFYLVWEGFWGQLSEASCWTM